MNKADINYEKAAEIEKFCNENNIPVFSKIPYDKDVTLAQIEGKSVVEFSNCNASVSIKNLWKEVFNAIG